MSQKHFLEVGRGDNPALAPEVAAMAWKKISSLLPRASAQDGWIRKKPDRLVLFSPLQHELVYPRALLWRPVTAD